MICFRVLVQVRVGLTDLVLRLNTFRRSAGHGAKFFDRLSVISFRSVEVADLQSNERRLRISREELEIVLIRLDGLVELEGLLITKRDVERGVLRQLVLWKAFKKFRETFRGFLVVLLIEE